MKRAGLRRIRFHDLRHVIGSTAVRTLPLSDVQAMLGLAHITTTMRYVHHRPGADDAARLSQAFKGDAESPLVPETARTGSCPSGRVGSSPTPGTAPQSGIDCARSDLATPRAMASVGEYTRDTGLAGVVASPIALVFGESGLALGLFLAGALGATIGFIIGRGEQSESIERWWRALLRKFGIDA